MPVPTTEYHRAGWSNMKLTVLVDNNTLIDRYFIDEPGVSYFMSSCERLC